MAKVIVRIHAPNRQAWEIEVGKMEGFWRIRRNGTMLIAETKDHKVLSMWAIQKGFPITKPGPTTSFHTKSIGVVQQQPSNVTQVVPHPAVKGKRV